MVERRFMEWDGYDHTHVVKAIDYDALAAELAGTKDELYSVDKAAKELGERVAALEAELAELKTPK
jgi:uncharacterized small protein (DUF1192 family)